MMAARLNKPNSQSEAWTFFAQPMRELSIIGTNERYPKIED